MTKAAEDCTHTYSVQFELRLIMRRCGKPELRTRERNKQNSVQTPLSHPPPQLTDSLNSLFLSRSPHPLLNLLIHSTHSLSLPSTPPQLTDSFNSLTLSLFPHLLPMSLVTMIVLLCSNWLFSGCISGHASCSRVGKSAEKEKSLTWEVWGEEEWTRLLYCPRACPARHLRGQRWEPAAPPANCHPPCSSPVSGTYIHVYMYIIV